MPRPVLPIVLAAICAGSVSGGCEFYTASAPYDADITDVGRADDVLDLDPDSGLVDGTVVDAAPQVDAAFEQCGQVGGVCTANPNAICPPGTQPYGDDEPLDCAGHCCVPNLESTCNANPDTNCSMSAACVGCWAPIVDTALVCAGGRPCCEWTCGG